MNVLLYKFDGVIFLFLALFFHTKRSIIRYVVRMILVLIKTFNYSLHFLRILCFLFVLVGYSFTCLLFELFFRSFRKIALGINLVGCFRLLGRFLLSLFFSCEACFVVPIIAIFVNALVLVVLIQLNLSLLIL